MENMLYALVPGSDNHLSFGWTYELAGKLDTKITILGSYKDFLSMHGLQVHLHKLLEKHRDEAKATTAPTYISVLRQEPLPEAVENHLSEHPDTLSVFSHHFAAELPLFRYLETHKHSYIHLSPNTIFDLPASSGYGSYARHHAFYHVFQRARKLRLSHGFYHQLAKDTYLPGFLTKYFRQEASGE